MTRKKIGIFTLISLSIGSITYASNVKENLDYLFDTKFPISDYVWNHSLNAHNKIAINSMNSNKGRKILLDKNGNPILDEFGNPIYVDEDGNLYTIDGKALAEKILLDKDGNPIMNKDGKPIIYDKNGNIKGSENKVLVDKFGNPLLDKDGNPILIDKNGNLQKQNGMPITDENGNPINIQDKEKLDELLSQNANNSIAEQERKERGRLLKEEAARRAAEEEAKRRAEEIARIKAQEEAKRKADPAYQALLQEQKTMSLYKSAVLGERIEGNSRIFAQQSSRYGDSGFSNQQSIDVATNEHRLYRMIRAGRLIPAVLTTPIISNIEGIITAQVEQDIYAAQGRAVLIPRGTKVMGFYKNDNKIGQSRLSIVWREMITPQGVNILLTNAVSADSRGINGIEGYLDNKFGERYGLGLFLNTLSNGLMISISNLTQKDGTATSPYTAQLFSQAQGDINNIFKQLISEQAKIKPTIEIRAGSRIYITPTTHMWFPIPKNGEVMAQYFNDEYN